VSLILIAMEFSMAVQAHRHALGKLVLDFLYGEARVPYSTDIEIFGGRVDVME
jgi:hypothetical protein